MSYQMQAGPRINRRALFAGILGVNICAIFLSLWSSLFGPRWGIIFGVAGFLIGWSSFFFGRFCVRVTSVRGIWTPLNETTPGIDRLERSLDRVTRVLLITAGIAIGLAMTILLLGLLFLGSDKSFDVPGIPVLRQPIPSHFEGRSVFLILANYSSGVTIFVGWHVGSALMSFAALHYVLFGRMPKCLLGSR